jgi:hypothetical protein
MTVLDTLNFVAFKQLANNNPIAVRRRKLIVKLEMNKSNLQRTKTTHLFVHNHCCQINKMSD